MSFTPLTTDEVSARPGATASLLSRLPPKVQLHLMRLNLAWQSRRVKRGRRIDIEPAGEHYVIDDGLRRIHIPDLQHALRYCSGIAARLDEVAAKYGGQRTLRLADGAIVVDVGANIGEFALWCVDAGARVIAFEPDPTAFSLLEKNLHGVDGTRTVPHAVWHGQQVMPLHCSRDTLTSSLFARPTNQGVTAMVEAWSLDAAASVATLPRIELLKIDAEGAEPEVLAGATRTLRHVHLVVVDIGEDHRRANLRFRVTAALEAQGLRLVADPPNGVVVAINDKAETLDVQYPRRGSITL